MLYEWIRKVLDFAYPEKFPGFIGSVPLFDMVGMLRDYDLKQPAMNVCRHGRFSEE
jgi:hypothetical protein